MSFHIRQLEHPLNEFEYVVARFAYFIEIARGDLRIVYVLFGKRGKAEYRVKRSAQIVRHIGKKCVFCYEREVRVFESLFEQLFLLDFLRNLFFEFAKHLFGCVAYKHVEYIARRFAAHVVPVVFHPAGVAVGVGDAIFHVVEIVATVFDLLVYARFNRVEIVGVNYPAERTARVFHELREIVAGENA